MSAVRRAGPTLVLRAHAMLQGVLSTAVTALLAVAAASDAAQHRIPNALPLAIAAFAVASRSIAQGFSGAASGVLALLATGALLFPAWSRRAVGGGDLKLAAAAAAWVGIARLPLYLLASALAGGLLAVACYAASEKSARRQMRANLLLGGRGVRAEVATGSAAGRVPLPAGAAFAVGAMVGAFYGG